MTMDARKQRLLNLLDALAHDACVDAESAEKDLRDAGLDPDEIKKQGVRFVQGLQKELRLRNAKVKRQQKERALSELRERTAERLRAYGGQAKDILLKRLRLHQPEFNLNFRKLEALDPEDLVEILDEIELLKLLSEMEEDSR